MNTWRDAPPDDVYTDGISAPRTLTIGPPRDVQKDYDESLHPRDEKGLWTTGGGATLAVSPDARRAYLRFERAHRHDEVETVAVVHPVSGKVLVTNTGLTSYKVEIPRTDVSKVDGAIVTHNHPIDRSLSTADIILAQQHNALAVRAVTPSGTVYELRRLGEWPAQFMGTYDKESGVVSDSPFQRVSSGQLTGNQADALFSHEVLARTAQHYPNAVRYTRSAR